MPILSSTPRNKRRTRLTAGASQSGGRPSGSLGDGGTGRQRLRTALSPPREGLGFLAGVGASLQPRGFEQSLALSQGIVSPEFFQRDRSRLVSKKRVRPPSRRAAVTRSAFGRSVTGRKSGATTALLRHRKSNLLIRRKGDALSDPEPTTTLGRKLIRV